MRILGISAFYHDSAAALVEGGTVVAAAQEERFTRKKHDARFPRHAIAYCLAEAGVTLDQVDHVAFYDKPFLKFERLLETYLAFAPRGFRSFSMAIPVWLREKLFQKALLKRELRAFAPEYDWQNRLLFAEHHQSHAASAFFASPFPEAVILTMDGVGEWATTSVGFGSGNHLEMRKEIHFPHSLGLLYSAFTYYTGFKVNSGEYKVMGLAPYGEPSQVDALRKLVRLEQGGGYRLDLRYFRHGTERVDFHWEGGEPTMGTIYTPALESLLGPARKPDEELTQRHRDIARSVQAVYEEAFFNLLAKVHSRHGCDRLVLAGGCAMNSVANGKIAKRSPFKQVYVQSLIAAYGTSRWPKSKLVSSTSCSRCRIYLMRASKSAKTRVRIEKSDAGANRRNSTSKRAITGISARRSAAGRISRLCDARDPVASRWRMR